MILFEKRVFDMLDRILNFSIVRTIPFNPSSSFVGFVVFFSSLCESYQRGDILALSAFTSAAVPWQGTELCLQCHLWVPNTVLIKGCIGDFSVNGGKISQLEMCVTLLRKRWWLCVPTLACVVVLPECDVQQQTNKMPKDRMKLLDFLVGSVNHWLLCK